MRAEMCSQFLRHLNSDFELAIGKSSERVIEWLDKAKLPWDLDRLLRFNWPQASGGIGCLQINSVREILEHDGLENLLAQRLLPIGSGPNGDVLAICYETDQCPTGFISHEECYDHQHALKEVFQPVARTLESLLYRIVENRFIPCDYYAAKEFNAFLEEERSNH